ncbi:long-chain-fatty-acid--CoA ligase [Archaeoglobus neptunius]|uniref:long-chain-fatty-acid--CoA ligase n=1 Tax=Archaeoglobus neptunius TaxID=2798580 RepID=UPI001927963A|nr:long-chain-fatty-acid--CoA ligase [Archaeoglobus neptunius]
MNLKYNLSVKKTLFFPLHAYAEKEIVYRDVVRYTYREFYERLQRIASSLESMGAKNSKIAFIDWNTHQYLEGMFAIPMMGSILHCVNLRLAPEEIVYTMRYVEDDFVVIRDEFLPLAEKLAPHVPSVKGWIVTGDDIDKVETTLKPLYFWEDLIKEGSGYEFPELSENETAIVYFTSGTTGLPKAVHFSHRQVVMQAIINGLALSANISPARLSSADVIMHIPPFFHGMGWTFPYLATMLGMKQVLPGRYEPKVMLDLIKNEGVTYAGGVPVFLKMLLDYPDVENYRDALSRFKFVCDGEHPQRVLFERARELGIKMIEAFGMSEGVGFTFAVLKDHMLYWGWEKQVEYLNKAGLPAPFVEIKIVDGEGNEVERDFKTMGEILIRSPGLTEGYWKNPEKTSESWDNEGWFHTGDLGVWDEEGYILILDRAKDVIKSGGEWISSIRLEGLILEHPAVSEAAVIGVRSEKWSERPIAVVVPKPGKGVTEQEIIDFLMKNFVETGKIPKWWLPDRVFVVDEIPKTTVGKINKRVLRDRYKDLILP